ncbi:MAG: hypothetical protein ABI551_06570 [Polyangiaceae bacterium]
MNRRLPAAMVAAFLSFILARPAFGEPARKGACDKVTVELAESLSKDWIAAGVDLTNALATSEAPCTAVALRLEPAATGARLSATTPDGSIADRAIAQPSALVPTALGLVASLPPDAAPPPPTAPKVVAMEKPSAPPSHLLVVLPARPGPTSLWFGVSTGVRIGEPSFLAMMDIEARVTLERGGWLAFGSIRYGSSLGETLVWAADASYDEVAGAIGVGRRFPIGTTNLDLALVPSLVSASLGDDDETGAGTPSRLELRVGASAQWWLVTGEGWRITLTVDTDVAPRGLERPLRSGADDPPLPAWTAGLRLGASGSIL